MERNLLVVKLELQIDIVKWLINIQRRLNISRGRRLERNIIFSGKENLATLRTKEKALILDVYVIFLLEMFFQAIVRRIFLILCLYWNLFGDGNFLCSSLEDKFDDWLKKLVVSILLGSFYFYFVRLVLWCYFLFIVDLFHYISSWIVSSILIWWRCRVRQNYGLTK